MKPVTLPQNIILDVGNIVSEFMGIYLPGGGPLSNSDKVFVEEVLTVIAPALIDSKNFEYALNQSMVYFADNTIHYQDNIEQNDRWLLAESASIMAQAIFMKLNLHGAYINGFFPYVFKYMSDSRVVIFELAPEYIGDRYCDPGNEWHGRT